MCCWNKLTSQVKSSCRDSAISEPLAIYNEQLRSLLLTQPRFSCVLSQLVGGQVGGVQPDLWRRGTDAAGWLCPEEQADPRRRPGWLWLRPADTCQEAGLQHSQLSPGVDRGVVVTGKAALKLVPNSRHIKKKECMKEDDNLKPSSDDFSTFYESDLSGFTTLEKKQSSPWEHPPAFCSLASSLCLSTGFIVSFILNYLPQMVSSLVPVGRHASRPSFEVFWIPAAPRDACIGSECKVGLIGLRETT